MCPNENKRSLAEVSEANKIMILLPGLAIKIVNEKKSQSYRLLKGISSKNVYHRIQMTLMQCGRQFYYKIVYPKEICKCEGLH